MLLFEKYDFYNSLSQLMLETKIHYSDEMKDVLSRLNTDISRKLISLINQEIDTDITGFDILHRNDMVKFMRVAGTAKYYKITHDGHIYSVGDHLRKLLDIEPDEKVLNYLPVGTIGTIKKIDVPAGNFYYNHRNNMVHFTTNDKRQVVMLKIALREVDGGKDQEARVGRAFRKLLKSAKIEFSDKQIEEFVNAYKARIDIVNNKFRLIDIVKGEKIRHWYHKRNNIRKGELKNSCMAYDECQGYLDIYVFNQAQVELLILKDEDDALKIRARAIIWTLETGEKYMDRAYGTSEPEMNLLRAYAEEQGWYYLKDGIYKDGEKLPGSEHGYEKIVIKLDEVDFYSYPYMDTCTTLIKSGDLEGYIGTIAGIKSKMKAGEKVRAWELEDTDGEIYSYSFRK